MNIIYEPQGKAKEYADRACNLYNGCTHGCSYCVAPGTLILMANGTTKPIKDIMIGDEIYGVKKIGGKRRYKKTLVLNHWSSMQYAYVLELENGISVTCSGNHRWLTSRGDWKYVTGRMAGMHRRPYLTEGKTIIRGLGKVVDSTQWKETFDYKHGYLCGIMQGDGCIGKWKASAKLANGENASLYQARLTMKDGDAVDRAYKYFKDFGIEMIWKMFPLGSKKQEMLPGIITSQREQVKKISEIIRFPYHCEKPTHEFYRGFLAGIFDAEGSFDGKVIRLSNSDPKILVKIHIALREYQFKWVYDKDHTPANKKVRTVRILGGIQQILKFFQITQPAIERKKNIEGRMLRTPLGEQNGFVVRSIKERQPELRKIRMYDITTGTGNFIANGLVSHNCYGKRYKQDAYYADAAPKQNVIAKLRKDVMSLNGDTPEILMSFQGDVYQPAELELGLTRQAIELFIEHDVPFTVLTKGGSRAVRDFDLLEGYDKARFGTSLVFFDEDMAREFEPHAASTWDRIATIDVANRHGIPTWVSLEPVIEPGQALALIEILHDMVDFWKVGKINHNRELEQAHDWVKFREDVTNVLEKYGCQYYLKRSLTELG